MTTRISSAVRSEWGFDVWAHNACQALRIARGQARALADAGVPGAARLLRRLNGSPRGTSGYIAQAQRAYRYWRQGRLQAVEARVSPNNAARVDLRLTSGLRVEVKSWQNFDASWVSDAQRAGMIERLRRQVTTYLQTPGSKLRLEFVGSIPDAVRAELRDLQSTFRGRLTYRTVH